jgi:hypothetical protein
VEPLRTSVLTIATDIDAQQAANAVSTGDLIFWCDTAAWWWLWLPGLHANTTGTAANARECQDHISSSRDFSGYRSTADRRPGRDASKRPQNVALDVHVLVLHTEIRCQNLCTSVGVG